MKKLNAYNECNEREINSMVGKAACAWANRECALKSEKQLRSEFGDKVFDTTTAAQLSEYEATVRCIGMFVRESLPQVCEFVIAEAEKMMA